MLSTIQISTDVLYYM